MIEQTDQMINRYMKQGYNCCESVLLTADNLWNFGLTKQTLTTAKFFGEGMHSGCSCGALVGVVMAAGILFEGEEDAAGAKLPNILHSRFVAENGSSCCTVLRKNQGLGERINNKGCCRITQKAFRILVHTRDDHHG